MNIRFVRPSPTPRPRCGRRAAAWSLAAAALCLAAPAPAQVAPTVPPATLARALALAAEAATTLAPHGARVQVEPGRLDSRLTLAPCARVDAYLPSGVPAWGRSRVGLRCTDGRTRWNVFLPVTVQVWAPALVAAAALPPGARLSAGQLSRAEVDWAAASAPPFGPAETLSGRTLARAVAAGQPLRVTDLQPRQWFGLGDSVRIVAVGDGFSIVAEGQALAAGLEGQSVRVRTESGRVLVGRPVADRRVEVNL